MFSPSVTASLQNTPVSRHSIRWSTNDQTASCNRKNNSEMNIKTKSENTCCPMSGAVLLSNGLRPIHPDVCTTNQYGSGSAMYTWLLEYRLDDVVLRAWNVRSQRQHNYLYLKISMTRSHLFNRTPGFGIVLRKLSRLLPESWRLIFKSAIHCW